MPAATNMASATIKFCPIVINLIKFIEQKHRSQRYLVNSKLKKNRGNFGVYVTIKYSIQK
jgi:hypothetical protein